MTHAARILAFLALPLALLACGFEPMYGERAKSSASGSKALAGVAVEPMPGRVGQIFHTALEDQLNPGGSIASPAFKLKATITYVNIPVGVGRDGTVDRFNVNFNSQYLLTRIADNTPVTSGSITYSTSYNNLANSYYSTYVAEQDSHKRGAQALAELYRQRLMTYLDAGAPKAESVTQPKVEAPVTPEMLLRQQQGTTINLPQQ